MTNRWSGKLKGSAKANKPKRTSINGNGCLKSILRRASERISPKKQNQKHDEKHYRNVSRFSLTKIIPDNMKRHRSTPNLEHFFLNCGRCRSKKVPPVSPKKNRPQYSKFVPPTFDSKTNTINKARNANQMRIFPPHTKIKNCEKCPNRRDLIEIGSNLR